MSENRPIPLYTKIGGRITILLLLLLAFMLVKNCAGSIHYGTTTSQQEIRRYYDMGYAQGNRQTPEQATEAAPTTDNPLLQKAYRRGFRAGWDSRQRQGTAGDR